MSILSLPTYILAALAEIAGCFSFWAWLKLGKTPLWLIPGLISLSVFAWLLTKLDMSFAGRTYASYGGVYILSSLLWMWGVEGNRPDRWDIIGTTICLIGSLIILYAPRHQ